MTYRSGVGTTEKTIGRGGAHKLMDPSTIAIEKILSHLRGENILIIWKDDFFDGGYVNGWLSYFARNNRVWVTNPILSDINLRNLRDAKWELSQPISRGYLVVSDLFFPALAGSDIELLWKKPPYYLYRISGPHWLAMTNLSNPNGIEKIGQEYFFWLGRQEAIIEIISAHQGRFTFQADTFPGPSLPERKDRFLSFKTGSGFHRYLHLGNQEKLSINIPISTGLNQIIIQAHDIPTVSRLPNGDTRVLLLQIRNWRIKGSQMDRI